MRVVDLAQRSEPWHNWRRLGLSASESAAILGYHPDMTPWRLWAEKTGKIARPDLDRNPNVIRGQQREDWVRQRFEHEHDEVLLPVCVESDENPLFRASLDGMTGDGRPVEMKVPHPTTYRDVLNYGRTSKAYLTYWPQVQHQLYVTGATHGYLCFLCTEVERGLEDYIEFRIERDETFIREELIPGGLAFWQLLEKRKEPPRDPQRDLYLPDTAAIPEWSAAVAEYRETERFVAAAAKRLDDLKDRLAEKEAVLEGLMGENRIVLVQDLQITRFSRAGSIDWKRLVDDHLPHLAESEIERYRRPPSKPSLRITDRDKSGRQARERAEAQATRAAADNKPAAELYAW